MIEACFSEQYAANTRTPSMRKLQLVAQAVSSQGFVRLVEPSTMDIATRLRRLHDPRYVDAFIAGNQPLANSQGWQWTPSIRDGVLAINAGQLCAAELALEHGIAANIAQGFHHAGHARGCGYCTFNGLALVAQENPGRRIFVLDCDEHEGNGTCEFTKRMDNLRQATIFGSNFGGEDTPRSVQFQLDAVTDNWPAYEEALTSAFALIKAWRPDLVIYQAGADPHIDDPCGLLAMTTRQLLMRDRMVFDHMLGAGIPVLFVLAGGYQKMEPLVQLHVNTFRAAQAAVQSLRLKRKGKGSPALDQAR